jgi:CO/xanthine dehydrogenase Mo-binding subunit
MSRYCDCPPIEGHTVARPKLVGPTGTLGTGEKVSSPLTP